MVLSNKPLAFWSQPNIRVPSDTRAFRDRCCHGAQSDVSLHVSYYPASSVAEALLSDLRLCSCLDPAIAIKPVFERFSSVVITSGTISPLDMYPKMLQFTPVVQETYAMSLTRNAFLPLVSAWVPHIFFRAADFPLYG